MDPTRRRELLQRLSLLGAAGLAGCQGLSSDEQTDTTGETKTNRTTTTDSATVESTDQEMTTQPVAAGPTFDLQTAIETGDTSQHIVVTGRITADAGVDSVTVETQGVDESLDAGGESEFTLDTTLAVEGGRAYQITVSAVTGDGREASTQLETDHVPVFAEPLETERLVGAHYYPWYEMSGGHQDWTEWTVSDPVLGEYSADDPRVVDQHLKWCLEYGIDWLSVSWWGPGSGSDTALDGTITEMERFDDVQFSILYETVGRLEAYEYDLDRSAARERLQSDFEYLAERYFGRENYLHIDGQPVVYFYVSNNLSGDVEAAFADATANLDTDLYVLAGVPFGSAPATYPIIDVADAVTSYNPYRPRADIEAVFHDNYEQGNKVMNLGARVADIGFVPVVIPGFNDTGLPDNVREDNPILSSSPDRYERVLEQVRPHLADSEAVLITSFNEWYEDTQVEPGTDFGTEYLELTAEKLANATSAGFTPQGTTLRFAFNETIVPAETNPDSTDDSELAFMAGGLRFLDDGEAVASFDIGDAANEPLLLKGVYGTASNDSYSWRWFGGPDAETVLFVEADISNADTAVLTGEPMRSDRIEAEVFVDGTKTDQLVFGERDGRLDDYTFAVQ